MATMDEAAGWAEDLEQLLSRLGSRFGRVEVRRQAGAYLRGLLAPVERKNGWQLAEAAGDARPDGMQDFLARMRWDADAVRAAGVSSTGPAGLRSGSGLAVLHHRPWVRARKRERDPSP